jgi:hypothetical protein
MILSLSEPWIFDILSGYPIFVSLVVFATMAVGLASKSLAVGSLGAYVTFIYLAINSNNSLFNQIAIVTLVLTAVGFAFKFWRLEGLGDTA